jgi:uncharacterized repeat protein (TIGR03803 family)
MKSFDPPVVGNLARSRARRQKAIACAVIDALEQRMLLSGTGTLTPIASFNGVDGYSPNSGVADANGNIFGATLATTDDGGNTFGPGVVYEIPAGTGTIKDLVTFPDGASGTVGAIDSAGDVFGVEAGATANVPDTVFEIPAGTSTLTPLATFPTQTLGNQGTVTAVDSAGDVFGLAGGAPFEIVNGSGVMTALENQNGSEVSFIDLLPGPGGNLYGTGTDQNGNNVIADVSPSTGNVTTLATIDPTTIGTFPQGIAIDPSGNIWGLMQYGGSAGQGSIFELPAGSNTVSLIGSFTAATGDTPVGPPVFDASGNLYGLTSNDGANGDGTVFEIPAGGASAGPVDLVDLNSSEGDSTSAGFVINNAGTVPAIDGYTLAVFGGLFTGQASASAAIGHAHQDVGPNGNSTGDVSGVNKKKTTPPLIPPALKLKAIQEIAKADGLSYKAAEAKYNSYFPKGGPGIVFAGNLEPADGKGSPQAKLSAPLAQIKKMLATAGQDLKSVNTLINKDTGVTAQYTKEGNTITALEAQLAAQTKASSEAKIQKEITADTSIQARFANQCDSFYNTGTVELNNIGTLITDIQAALNALSS